jgi:large subunit ribosomal protein L27
VAHKKGQGSSKNGRDSNAQFRGIKLYGGQEAKAGAIIVRQCGTPFKAGYLVQRCKDDTLMARAHGTVRFRGRTVDIIPSDPDQPRYKVVDDALAARKAAKNASKKAANN